MATVKIFDKWTLNDFNSFFRWLEKFHYRPGTNISFQDCFVAMGMMTENKKLSIGEAEAKALLSAYLIFRNDRRSHLWHQPLKGFITVNTRVSWNYSDWESLFKNLENLLESQNKIESNLVDLHDDDIQRMIDENFEPHHRKPLSRNLVADIRQSFLHYLSWNDDRWKLFLSVSITDKLPPSVITNLEALSKGVEPLFKYVDGNTQVKPVNVQEVQVTSKLLAENSTQESQTKKVEKYSFAVKHISAKQAYHGFIPLTNIFVPPAQVTVVHQENLDEERIKALVRLEIEKIFGKIEPEESTPDVPVPTPQIPVVTVSQKAGTPVKEKIVTPKKVSIMILGFKNTQLHALQEGVPKHVRLESYIDFDSVARKRIGQVDYIYITRFGGHSRVDTIKAAGIKNYEFVSGGVSAVRSKILSYIDSLESNN